MSLTQSEMVIFDQPHIARNRFKIAIVGDARVGKSSFARRLVQNKFDQHQQETPTIQAVQLRICDGYVAKIEIIDIADTKTDQHLRSALIDVSGVMLVYDSTQRASFDGLPTLIADLKSLIAPDAELMLVGAKCDVSPTTVPFADADAFATRHALSLFETSARSGLHCRDALVELVEKIREKFSDETESDDSDAIVDSDIFAASAQLETSPPVNIWCRLWRCH